MYAAVFPNNKIYIGIASNLRTRKSRHKFSAVNNDYQKFYKAIRKYGFDSVDWYIIDRSDCSFELRELEKFYIQLFDTYKNGYNMTLGGDGWYGRHHSKKTKEILRNQKLGTKLSDETKKRMSESRSGSKHPLYGVKVKKSTKTKISQSLKKWHKKRGQPCNSID